MPQVVETVNEGAWSAEVFSLASSYPYTYTTLPCQELSTPFFFFEPPFSNLRNPFLIYYLLST